MKTFAAAGLVVLVSVGAVETLKRRSAPAAPAVTEKAPPAAQLRGMTVLQENGQGHFVATALINGITIQTIVDTGASLIALSMEDAARIGIFPNPNDFKVSLS